MKRKRESDGLEDTNEPARKKQMVFEKYFLESNLILPDQKVATACLRTNVKQSGWVITVTNPYFPELYFCCYMDDVEYERKDVAFDMMKKVLEGEEDESLKKFRFFFTSFSKEGTTSEICQVPQNQLFAFVFEVTISVDQKKEDDVIFYVCHPRKRRETEEYYENEIKRLQERVEDLEEELESKSSGSIVPPPPPPSSSDKKE